jgi:methionine synthase II (cobalamin-independent)
VTGATGVGSWPGTDPAEAARTVLGELGTDGGPGVLLLPFLPELPARGPGTDLVGRAAALLVGLSVDLQPSGWRLVDRPGRDVSRARTHLTADLDALAEAADGFTGPLKTQVAGPWTLAAGLELTRGERSVADPGARRDLVASLAEGVAAHLGAVRRAVPGADLVLQIDEPSLPAVLEGRLPTASGYGRLRAVDPAEARAGLAAVLAAARGAGAVTTAVHCCAPDAPIALLREAGAGAVAVDLSLLGPADWESLAVGLEAGVALWAGAVRTDGAPGGAARPRGGAVTARAGAATAGGSTAAVVEAVRRPWSRLGLPAAGLADVVVTPACGLAGLSPGGARSALSRCVAAARALAEASEEG